jgi:hypothetical protein
MPKALLTHARRRAGLDLKQHEEIGTGRFTGIGRVFGCSGKWNVKKSGVDVSERIACD